MGIEPNEKTDQEHLDNSLMLVNAPSTPTLDMRRRQKISLTAYREDISLRGGRSETRLRHRATVDSWVHPEEMTHATLRG